MKKLIIGVICFSMLCAGCAKRHMQSRISTGAGTRDSNTLQTHGAVQGISENNIKQKPSAGSEDAELHRTRGLLLRDKHDINGAIREMEMAVDMAPNRAHYRYELARIYEAGGRDGDALKSALLAMGLAGKSKQDVLYAPIYSAYAADLLKRSKQIVQAERVYEKALGQLSAYSMEWTDAGLDKLASSGHLQRDLEKHIRKELAEIKKQNAKTRPNEEWVWRHIPSIQIDWRKYRPTESQKQQAVEIEKKLREGKTSGSYPHYTLGHYYLHSDRLDEAVIQFLAALELDAKDPVAWDELAMTYLRLGRLDDAVNAFQNAVNLGNTSSAVFVQDTRKAAKQYERR